MRQLVELHGGTVHADSRGAGQGATFTVELPRVEADVTITSLAERASISSADDQEAWPRAALTGYRLLVVDDQADARELMTAILTGAGAHVETASSVQDALREIEAARPDALLADIGMPGADGYVLIREVRRRDAQKGRHLPAAAITAYAGDHDRQRAVAAGFDCHVAKPVSRSAVVDAVFSICPRRGQVS